MFIAARKAILILLLSFLLTPGIGFGWDKNMDSGQKEDPTETHNGLEPIHTFDDNSTLTISENTVMRIDSDLYNSGINSREKVITVTYGWARLNGIRNKNPFKVITPSTIAEGSDTEFSAVVSSEGKTTLMVSKGKISALPKINQVKNGSPFLISEGEAQDFYPNGSYSPVRKLIRW